MNNSSENILRIIKQLYDNDIIKTGDFTLKSGVKSNIYINLRQIIAHPRLLKSIAYSMYSIMNSKYDLICGCAYSGIPIATTISTKYDIPMIFKRKEAKGYGTKQLIEGNYKSGDRVLLIDDVLTSGSSLKENIEELESVGLVVENICVFADRRKRDKNGMVCENTKLLEDRGYSVHTVTTLDYILKTVESFEQENGKNEKNEKNQDYQLTNKDTLPGCNKIFVALDGLEYDDLISVVDQLSNRSNIAFKLNDAYVKYGTELVEYIQNSRGDIFLDLKFFDIPNTIENYGRAMVDMEIYMFNVHCMVGREALSKLSKVVEEHSVRNRLRKPLIIGVTILTSMDKGDMGENFGTFNSIDLMVIRLAKMAKECGLDGVVCSPQEIKMVKEACGANFLTVTPGVRPKWAGVDDQKRIMTPGDVIKSGGDHLVIGRPIVMADRYGLTRSEAVDRIIKEISCEKIDGMMDGIDALADKMKINAE